MAPGKTFWPNDITLRSRDTILGWRLSNGWTCVAAVLRHDETISAPELAEWLEDYGLDILGVTSASEIGIHDRRSGPDNVTWALDGACSDLLRLHHNITYDPPDTKRLRYLTLRPISFTLQSPIDPIEEACAAVLDDQEAFAGSSIPTKDASDSGLRSDMDPLEEIIMRINQVREVRSILAGLVVDVLGVSRGDVCPGAGRKSLGDIGGVGQRIASWIASMFMGAVWTPLGFPFAQGSKTILEVHRMLRTSATFRQLCLRAQQARSVPSQWLALYAHPSDPLDIKLRSQPATAGATQGSRTHLAAYSVRYIEFYNTVWLVVNDAIIGWTIGAILRGNSTLIGDLVSNGYQNSLRNGLQESLIFLDNWPVGLKLNTPLSALLRRGFGSMAETSFDVSCVILSHLPLILWIVSLVSSLGATFFLCIISDAADLATLHVRFATWSMSMLYKGNMSGLYSLWNLFRGKRWNVMRLRVDRYDYENDQLFLGTLLFTILLFLTPTIWAYYMLFAGLRLAILGLHLVLETTLAFLNAFPLFAMILRVKEPSRLPGGVYFVVPATARVARSHTDRRHLELRGQPITFHEVFAQFWSSWAHIMTDYAPLRLLVAVMQGNL